MLGWWNLHIKSGIQIRHPMETVKSIQIWTGKYIECVLNTGRRRNPGWKGGRSPSTSWRCSPNSSAPRSQTHPSWRSSHTGRRLGTCPGFFRSKRIRWDGSDVEGQYTVYWQQWINHSKKWGLTQCFRSTSSSASHFRVRNGLFLLIISPAKNVVKVGYS